MMADANFLAVNLARVRERIARAARRAERGTDEITIVAVSKTFPVELICAAYDAGLREFGENRVQEFESKHPVLGRLVISNAYGMETSTVATLSVDIGCLAPPSGMVSWWPGEGNGFDIQGTNNGTLVNVTFVPGKVGQAFYLNGTNAYVNIPDSPSLRSLASLRSA